MSAARRIVRALSTPALCLATVGAIVLPATAHAADWTGRDARGDVVRVTSAGGVVVPQERRTDAVAVRGSYAQERLTVVVRARDLDRRSGQALVAIAAGTKDFEATARIGNSKLFPRFELTQNDKQVSCEGKRRTVDLDRDLVRLSVPASCLGAPSSVRIGAGLLTVRKTDGAVFADDALRADGIGDEIVLSPRIRRG